MRNERHYEATVTPDGTWSVEFHPSAYCQTIHIANGKAEDQTRGEIAARCAIEDDKSVSAKSQIRACGVKSFSVRA